MSYRYLVLGAGRQGTAAGYDLTQFGDAEQLWIADSSLDQAKSAAEKINALNDEPGAQFAQLDASDETSVKEFLEEHQIDVW